MYCRSSYEGLGGGIAWALDPAFCEQLLPSSSDLDLSKCK